MKKNSFLTFCFAMLPGAGQMYVGLMKKGVCLMSAFFGICLLSVTDIPYLAVTIPVIWCYSFFDAINYNNLPSEKKELVEDKLEIDKFTVIFIGLILVLSISAGGFHSFSGFFRAAAFLFAGVCIMKMTASNINRKAEAELEEQNYQN